MTLDNLSNHDRTKWGFFYDMNIIEFLNSISFYRDKQEWEYQRDKLNGRK